MRLDGRRQSDNVEDRRGRGRGIGGRLAGGGVIGVVIACVIAWLSGGNPLSVLTGSGGALLGGGGAAEQQYIPSEEEEELMAFSKQILAGTEDVWSEIFRQNGLTYEAPKLVVFTDAVESACGGATSATGPFYCSADKSLYLDLSFLRDMRSNLGADGDFAYAYVIAHEVGHHVQNLLGTLDKAHNRMAQVSESEANKISVRIELQADFYAGVWGYHDNRMFGSLEPGDVEEALDAASKIGDDYLQKKAQGYAVPDSFNHGTSDQRSRWLRKGLSTGDPSQGDTFSIPYSSL